MHPFRLNGWTVEPDRNVIRRGHTVVRLEPKTMGVLCALASRPGDVLSKAELLALVWSDVAVSDAVLTTAMYQLRRSLGDQRHEPRYVETVARGGYRLVAVVRPVASRRLPLAGAVAAVAVLIVIAVAMFVAIRGRSGVARLAAEEIHALAAVNLARGVEIGETVRLLRRAAELDPEDGAIAGSLALALTLHGSESETQAGVAAARALDRDSENVEARLARGLNALWNEWDWNRARYELQAAAATGDPRASAWLAYLLALSGEPERAAARLDGIEAPPLAVSTAATTRLLLGDAAGAEAALRHALMADPSNETLLRQLDKVRQRQLELSGAGAPPHAGPLLRPTDVARVHLEHGNVDLALTALERAWRDRDDRLLYLHVDRRWDSLRSHARFQAVARAVGP